MGLLDRATEFWRVVSTQDEDFLLEARRRQQSAEPFAGVIYAHWLNVPTGQCIGDLELIAKIYEPAEMAGHLQYLPLK